MNNQQVLEHQKTWRPIYDKKEKEFLDAGKSLDDAAYLTFKHIKAKYNMSSYDVAMINWIV